jgi:hypothetical protein
VSVEIRHTDGEMGSDFSCDEPVIIRLQFEMREPCPGLILTLSIQNLDGVRVLFSDIRDTDLSAPEKLGVGQHAFEVKVPSRLLAPGTYLLTINSTIRFVGAVDQHDACCEFTLRDLATIRVAPGRSSILGVLLPWEHQQLSPPGASGAGALCSSLAT